MTASSARHGSFTLSVQLAVPVDDVRQALVSPQGRRQWLRLPGRPGADDSVHYVTGAHEVLASTLDLGDRVERVERRTHVLEAGADRLVLTYEALVEGTLRWVSLVTVALSAEPAGSTTPGTTRAATRLSWTEQYAVVRASTGPEAGEDDDDRHLIGGTRLQLTGLALALGLQPEPATLVA